MAATLYPFTPSQNAAPQFTPTFDGEQYAVSIPWSLFGQRYYVKCVDLNGNLIYNQALVESPPGQPIETLAWDEIRQVANGVTAAPHGYKTAQTISLTIAGAAPDGYNGRFLVLITGPTTFAYPVAFDSDPGAATVAGILSYDIDMNGAYFDTPLVFRNNTFAVG